MLSSISIIGLKVLKSSNTTEVGICDKVLNISKNRLVIPYIKGLSDNLSQRLKNFGFDVVYSVPKKLNCIIKRYKKIDSF